eukprot:11512-Heterococcus_DN1.PRE.2
MWHHACALAATGDNAKMLEVMTRAAECRAQLSPKLYSGAMLMCKQAGKWNLALLLLAQMRAIGPQPTVVNYNAVIGECRH